MASDSEATLWSVEVSARLKTVLDELHLSPADACQIAAQLDERCKIGRSTLFQWMQDDENKKRTEPSFGDGVMLCIAIGVNPEWVLTGIGEKYRK